MEHSWTGGFLWLPPFPQASQWGDGMGFTSTCPSLPNPAAQSPRKTPQMLPFEPRPPAGGQANHGLLNLCQACQPCWALIASPIRGGLGRRAPGPPAGSPHRHLGACHWGEGGLEGSPAKVRCGREKHTGSKARGRGPACIRGPQSVPPGNNFTRTRKCLFKALQGKRSERRGSEEALNAGTSAAPAPQSQASKEGG